jgi:2-keto-3-deoxy-L-rhamnonate aldolase RhmA
MRKNRVKRALAAGRVATVFGGLSDADDIEAYAPDGFDGVWLEGEHGPVDARDIGNLTRACDLVEMTSIVRVNRNDQNLIYRTLDRGAQGIVVPHVNTKAEAENVVAGGKFAPLGGRGSFTSRQGFRVDDYIGKANDDTLLVILIEDIIAVENLDSILEVDHIDAFFVAPGDLAQTMGLPGKAYDPKVQDLVDETVQRIVAAGRVAGALVSNADAAAKVDAGAKFLFVPVGSWLATGGAAFLKQVASVK